MDRDLRCQFEESCENIMSNDLYDAALIKMDSAVLNEALVVLRCFGLHYSSSDLMSQYIFEHYNKFGEVFSVN